MIEERDFMLGRAGFSTNPATGSGKRSDPDLWEHATPNPVLDNLPRNLMRGGVKGVRAGGRMPLSLNIPDLPEGACRTVSDPDLFHPDNANSLGRIAKAKAICDGCPVKQQCLDWCLKFEHDQGEVQGGIWGGTTEWERKASGAERKSFCRSGRHEMVGNNVVPIKGGVRCRVCRNEADAAGKSRRKQEAEKIGA